MTEFIFEVMLRIVLSLFIGYASSYYGFGDFGELAMRMFVIFMVILMARYWLKDIVEKAIREGDNK